MEYALFYPSNVGKSYNVPPLGLLAISSYLSQNLKNVKAPIYNFARTTRKEYLPIIETIPWEDTPAAGISIMSTDVEAAIALASDLKAMNPSPLLIAGGPHVTLSGPTFLARHMDIDIIIVGDGEIPSLQLLLKLERGVECLEELSTIPGVYVRNASGNIVGTKPNRGLSADEWTNPFEADIRYMPNETLKYTDKLGIDHLAISLVTSRGCPLACTFCSIIAMNEIKYRSMEPSRVMDWLGSYRAQHKFEHIYFLDADFLVSRSRAEKWRSAIVSAFGGTVTWSVQANVGHILSLGSERLKSLREAGMVSAELGLEAGNDRQLRVFNKKNFGKPATVEQSMEAVRMLRESGVEIGVDYIMFYPELTLMELAENLVFLLRSGIVDTYDSGHYFNELILFPGTPLRKYYENKSSEPFDPDVLPESRDFYTSVEVLRVRDEFIDWYEKDVYPRTLFAREKLRQNAVHSSGRRKSELRLAELKLRHQPFHVLKQLILDGGARPSVSAWIEEDLKWALQLLSDGYETPDVAVRNESDV